MSQASTPSAPAASDRLPVETLLTALANSRRFSVVAFVARDTPRTASGLAGEIAALEVDGQPDRSDRKSVYTSLIQLHLPKLDDAGVIEYDPDRKTVTPGPHFAQARFTLDSTVASCELDAGVIDECSAAALVNELLG